MSDSTDIKILNRTLAERIVLLQQVTAELVDIRDELVKPVRRSGDVAADREAYAATLIDFSGWCDVHEVSMPLTLKRLVEIVMRSRVIELGGVTLQAALDHLLAAEPDTAGPAAEAA